ncbi:ATP-binding cassette domain-containing protein [Actinomadura rayongensis]|uniref:ATP-binding cassette domain-containing protein n=2 Tax=Actinomadura rayongensis TaxID=1429076 RepID=A0A6I4W5F4_9ACTN|nr:ATP-binding cassette domain-containing protein [Actinomadura rayongensis]
MHDVDASHLTHGVEVAFHDLDLTYGTGTLALHKITLTVRTGELVAIVGPSGCGKSSLLRLAAGLERASGGSVAVGTESVAFIFQEPTLLPWASVRRNVGLLGKLAKLPHDELSERVDAAIRAVGLTDFADQLPRSLSGGMRMRVSLARALALEPRVMLLDEPFGALDELTREEMQLQLLDLYDRRGFTALFVTHSVSEAVLLADRVVVMSARPGTIRDVVPIDLPRPRHRELRFDPAYVDYVKTVSDLLRKDDR